MGHTHYNELANDGRTIFAATRSTGQIEEGPVGYSIATLDAGVVSWRFKAARRRLPVRPDHSPGRPPPDARDGPARRGRCTVRALVFGAAAPARVACRVEDGGLGRRWTARRGQSGPGPPTSTSPQRSPCGIECPGRRRAEGARAMHSVRAAGSGYRAAGSGDGARQRRRRRGGVAGERHLRHPARPQPQTASTDVLIPTAIRPTSRPPLDLTKAPTPVEAFTLSPSSPRS